MRNITYLLQHHFIHSALSKPNKTALIINYERYTYQEIYRDCLTFKWDMQSKLSRGDRVLIQSGNTYLTIVAFWSALLLDAIPCIIDPETTDIALKNIIQKIDPAVIVFSQASERQYEVYAYFKKYQITRLPCQPARDSTHFVVEQHFFVNTESDLAMIMHTSGSTGDPKGVMLSHRNILAAVDSIHAYLELTQDDVTLSVLPMHFDYGLYQMLLTFSIGATLVLEKNCFFPNLVAHQIEKYQATVLPCVPLLVQLFYLSAKKYEYCFSSIRMVTNTGENLSINHIHKIKKLFPNAVIFSMYGLTECKRCSYVPPTMLDKKSESIGIAMPNLEMWVQDAMGKRAAPGVEGELVISGPTVMQGYWKNEAATSEKIKIQENGKRVLLSGDRVVMDEDGYFYFKGRKDFMIKFKGAKLNMFDYVKKISSLAAVERCYIFLDQFSDDPRLIICIECLSLDNTNDLKKSIYQFFSQAQKPDEIYFTDRFPSLSNGKLDKHALEKMVKESRASAREQQCI